jgi:hypothetical protein
LVADQALAMRSLVVLAAVIAAIAVESSVLRSIAVVRPPTVPVVGLSAPSAIEKISDNRIVAFADDATLVYVLSLADGAPWVVATVSLVGPNATDGIAKALKPDLEAAAAFIDPRDGRKKLLGIGSGSAKHDLRDNFFIVDTEGLLAVDALADADKQRGTVTPPHTALLAVPVEKLSATPILDRLRSDEAFIGSVGLDLMNIEGAEVVIRAGRQILLLFQRGNSIESRNSCAAYDLAELLASLRGEPGSGVVAPTISSFELPSLGGWRSGFSAASHASLPAWLWGEGSSGTRDVVVFSASVEATASAYEDGAVLGSYVGVLEVKVRLCGVVLVADMRVFVSVSLHRENC